MTPDPRLTALDALAARTGYAPVEPAVLQPAGLFLDLLGEEMRRRAFLTTDAAGTEYCLRPDYTVPVSRHHLAAGAAVGAYAYRGPVFRTDSGGTGERRQAGFESFGRADAEAADAEMLDLALETAALLGLGSPTVRLGDAALVAAMLDALALPPAWRRRLAADLRGSSALDDDLARLGRPAEGAGASYAGFLAALDGSAPGAARAAVTDLLALAGIAPVGGRGVEEIADRFLERAGLMQGGVPAEAVALARRFFAIAGDPDAVSASLRALAAEAGLAIEPALDAFDTRTGFLAARGVEVEAIRASTAFGRTLDYYTGMVFELADPTTGAVLGGGGRYDALLQRLGAPEPVPAVGCSIWLPDAPPDEATPEPAPESASNSASDPTPQPSMVTA